MIAPQLNFAVLRISPDLIVTCAMLTLQPLISDRSFLASLSTLKRAAVTTSMTGLNREASPAEDGRSAE